MQTTRSESRHIEFIEAQHRSVETDSRSPFEEPRNALRILVFLPSGEKFAHDLLPFLVAGTCSTRERTSGRSIIADLFHELRLGRVYRERRTQIAADIRSGVKGGLPVAGRGTGRRRNRPGRCSIASSCAGARERLKYRVRHFERSMVNLRVKDVSVTFSEDAFPRLVRARQACDDRFISVRIEARRRGHEATIMNSRSTVVRA